MLVKKCATLAQKPDEKSSRCWRPLWLLIVTLENCILNVNCIWEIMQVFRRSWKMLEISCGLKRIRFNACTREHSYTCTCVDGYLLSPNRINCIGKTMQYFIYYYFFVSLMFALHCGYGTLTDISVWWYILCYSFIIKSNKMWKYGMGVATYKILAIYLIWKVF